MDLQVNALWPASVAGDVHVAGLPFCMKNKAAARWAFECDTTPGGMRLLVCESLSVCAVGIDWCAGV